MCQVLQSGLLGQEFLLCLNLSSSIRTFFEKQTETKFRYDCVTLITASQEAPWQKPKGLRAWGDQQEVEVHTSASLWLCVPGCPAGLRRNEAHKEQPSAHINRLYWDFFRDNGAVIKKRSGRRPSYYHTAFWVFPQEASGRANEGDASHAVWDCNCNWPEQVLTYEPPVNCPHPILAKQRDLFPTHGRWHFKPNPVNIQSLIKNESEGC